MDIIFIQNLKVDTIIGIHPWERQIKQTLYFDIELGTDIRRCAEHDDITHALNYEAVARHVTHYVAEQSVKLIETLAARVADELLATFHVPWLRLKLSKPSVLVNAHPVGVVIERELPAAK
jgi:dihydroneopterin aldolase